LADSSKEGYGSKRAVLQTMMMMMMMIMYKWSINLFTDLNPSIVTHTLCDNIKGEHKGMGWRVVNWRHLSEVRASLWVRKGQ
jgi:hypothetical protein